MYSEPIIEVNGKTLVLPQIALIGEIENFKNEYRFIVMVGHDYPVVVYFPTGEEAEKAKENIGRALVLWYRHKDRFTNLL